MRLVLLAMLFAVLVCSQAQSDLIWSDGTIDPGKAPAGKLLSDNEQYWGDNVLTGVDYKYESPAQVPADLLSDNKTFGRRLLDGWANGTLLCPVGESAGEPLVVVFDFMRPCSFSEVDTISPRTPKTSLKLEVRDTEAGNWRTVYNQPLEKSAGKSLNRVKLRGSPKGRYLRLSLGSDTVTYLDEVLVWGDARVSAEYPEATNNVTKAISPPPGSLTSIPGIPATYFPLSRFKVWHASLGERQVEKAVWSVLSDSVWTVRTQRPILPSPAQVCERASFTMATNEIERLPVALTSTSSRPISLDVEAGVVVKSRSLLRRDDWETNSSSLLGRDDTRVGWSAPAKGIEVKLLVGGAMPFSKGPNDVQLLPFFEKANMLGRGLMKRYLTNADQICDFPKLKLQPGGSAVMWLSVETKNAAPGRYEAEIGYRGGRPVKVSVEVLNVKLPTPDVWITSWGNYTWQFPFESQDRRLSDLTANRRLGVNVFRGDELPTPGSKAELFSRLGKTRYHTRVLLNTPYLASGWNGSLKVEDIKAEDEAKIAEAVKRVVENTRSLGLTYDDWFTELWDEPGITNADVYGKIAGIIKKTDPNVNVYMNPLMWFWDPTEQQIIDALRPYYNQVIDISLPAQRLVGDNSMTKDLWAAPRLVRGSYVHPPSKAGRGMTWKSFKYGLNGWAYFSYYYPRGTAWDVSTWVELNLAYVMVLPGPNGPVLTPVYEDMREGWEDYRMLSALRKKGKEDVLAELIKGYDQGRPFAELRLKALSALAN